MTRKHPQFFFAGLLAAVLLAPARGPAQVNKPTAEQLARWLKQFPEADADGNGTLSLDEALAYRKAAATLRPAAGKEEPAFLGTPKLAFNPGWEHSAFPEEAVCRKTPEEILAIYRSGPEGRGIPAASLSFPRPANGGLRIVGTGHSFMAPGYETLPRISQAAGLKTSLCLHTGGGITGSTRYKWEQENGIFEFERDPLPKLLAAIANADWEAMLWGGYYCDRPEFYTCWIDFCTRYHPDMNFYLSDTWPQLCQLEALFGLSSIPESEAFFTEDILDRMGQANRDDGIRMVRAIRQQTTDRVFIIPTADAITEAAKRCLRGELPGVEGIHRLIGGKERSIWRDQIGHLGPGFDRLEGYVFFAALYGRSPEHISNPIHFAGEADYPSKELDEIFRQIAWQAVAGHPLSGVQDTNGNGIADRLE